MSNFINYIRIKYRKVYIFILFFICALVLITIMPKEVKFKYEFQKGSPWQHETLIAPYNFPIYKSDAEMKIERDSIMHSLKLYFRNDHETKILQIDRFTTMFDSIWAKNIHFIDTLLRGDAAYKSKLKSRLTNSYKPQIFKTTIQTLEFIYNTGVVETPDDFEEFYHGVDEGDIELVVLNEKNIAEDVLFSTIFSPKSGYEYLKNKFINLAYKENIDTLVNNNLIANLNLNEFIEPNLMYDSETTLNVKNTVIKEKISYTRDMIQEGQLIIIQGDVVNSEKYQILESLKREYETYFGDARTYYIVIVGQIILVAAMLFVLFLFLYNFRSQVLESTLKTSFILSLFLLIVVATSLVLKTNMISIYIVPITIQPILIKTFYDSRLAIFIHMVTILFLGFIAPNGFEFIFIQFFAGVIAVVSITNLQTRAQLFVATVYVAITYTVLYFGNSIITEGSIRKIDWYHFLWFAGNALLLLFSYPLIYIFEKIFGFLSDVTLIELSDTNRPLLRQLAEQAPGTFQHSLQVANLAEAAIQRIGGNPLLVRTGALYHDIGKMLKPNYFTENQQQGENPHNKLEFDKSAEIIIDHVVAGAELARKHKLPEQIIDFIRTHHGVSKVKYFYISFKNQFPDKEVDVAKFMYPGPLPYSKETAALMIADSLEAASRSLKIINPDTLKELIDKIVDSQIKEDQFNYANITFYDITMIKEEMKRKLLNIYHTRIEYPKEKVKEVVDAALNN